MDLRKSAEHAEENWIRVMRPVGGTASRCNSFAARNGTDTSTHEGTFWQDKRCNRGRFFWLPRWLHNSWWRMRWCTSWRCLAC